MDSNVTLDPAETEDASSVVTAPERRQAVGPATAPSRQLGLAAAETLPLPQAIDSSWRSLLHRTTRQLRNALPLLLVDLAVGLLSLIVINRLAGLWFEGVLHAGTPSPGLLYALPVLGATLAVLGLYPGTGVGPVAELRGLVLGSLSAAAAVLAMLLYAGRPWGGSFVFAALTLVPLAPALPLGRALARAWLSKRPWWGEPVLVFGSGPLGVRVHRLLARNASQGLRPLGVIDTPQAPWRREDAAESEGYLCPPEEAADLINEYSVQWAVIAAGEGQEAANLLTDEHTRYCLSRIPHRVVVGGVGQPSLWTESRECAGAAAVYHGERLLMLWPRFVKRTIDIVLTSMVALIAAPVLLTLAILVPLTSRGPIFYGQERIGRNGRRFKVWKFRTMHRGADRLLSECLDSNDELRAEWAADQKLRRDPRVTRVGRWLRSTSLDELPQLWNVLRGEMSLVGPRPIVQSEIAKYREVFPVYTRVQPGVTGWWQISGRNHTTYEQRLELDNYYVRNWSPWLDVYILARTVKTVLFMEGAY